MDELNKKDMQLRDLLYGLDCPFDDDFSERDRDRSIAVTVLAAKECGATDTAIDFVKRNKGDTLHEINYRLFVSDRIFPELEIVDDDELDDDEK